VWKRSIDGRELTFRLAGINNQNFLMRDEETGSFWQQISGKAISGPMRGRQLDLVRSDELTFGLWRSENPNGTVLRPVGEFESKYAKKDWDERMKTTETVVDTKGTGFGPRELMLGVEHNGAARAYVLDRVLKQKLIQDRIGSTPVIVVVGPDDKSVRVFEARRTGQDATPEFYRNGGLMIDSLTGSKWTFQGCAIEGPATGDCLKSIQSIRDYWFDWKLYHPNTTVHNK
jgi:hypothetical protein